MHRLWPVIPCCILLAAHHLRAGEPGLVGLWLTAPLLLWLRRPWVRLVWPLLLLAGAAEWGTVLLALARERAAAGEPATRLVAILGGAGLLTAAASLLFRGTAVRERFRVGEAGAGPGIAAFLLTAGLLVPVQLLVRPPGLLLERFLPAGGWSEAFWLAIYAAWLAERMQDPRVMQRWRPRLWLLFSGVFFLQLVLGLAGVERLLMTGRLHLPVPALIAAGPAYRGEGFFMPILFGASLLLVGPAWCSWLCYIGAWDDRAARRRRRPGPMPAWRARVRPVILVLVVGTALVLGRAGVPPLAATWAAAAFGLGGVAVMLLWSRRAGVMAHCTTYCPIGWLATRLGRLSPFRLRIDVACSDCAACGKVCRYDALSAVDIVRRRPGEACTLCGDCVSTCKSRQIDYTFLGLRGAPARRAFVILIASLHAAFLGVGRI
jgi:ferredoxin